MPNAQVSAPLTWEELPACELADFTLATVPARFARIGDPGAGIDRAAGSLDRLLELAERQAGAGQGDAPWPPHYAKAPGEPPRIMPSRRKSSKPLVEISRAATKEEALAAFERWKSRHPDAVAHLLPADLLVNSMRGRFTLWYRIRVNLEHVPAELRPPQEPLDADYDPWAEFSGPGSATSNTR